MAKNNNIYRIKSINLKIKNVQFISTRPGQQIHVYITKRRRLSVGPGQKDDADDADAGPICNLVNRNENGWRGGMDGDLLWKGLWKPFWSSDVLPPTPFPV